MSKAGFRASQVLPAKGPSQAGFLVVLLVKVLIRAAFLVAVSG